MSRRTHWQMNPAREFVLIAWCGRAVAVWDSTLEESEVTCRTCKKRHAMMVVSFPPLKKEAK